MRRTIITTVVCIPVCVFLLVVIAFLFVNPLCSPLTGTFHGKVSLTPYAPPPLASSPSPSTQVLRVEAEDLRMVDSVSSGDVAVAVGLPHAATGDTLVQAKGGLCGLQLDGVAIPPPVFFLAVEPESASQQARKTVHLIC